MFIRAVYLAGSLFFMQALLSQGTLPHPSGPLATGTRIFNLVDGSRYDSLLQSGRNVIVQVWYPCEKAPASRLADYIEDKRLVDSMIKQRYYDQDSLPLANFYRLRSNSYHNAPIEKSKKQLPLLFFSEGLGVARANYTSICEELASHGIVVVLIDHLYAGYTILPSGQVITTGHYQGTSLLPMVKDCIRDISFVLDELQKKGTAVSEFLAEKIDWTKVGAAGHSQGGNVAMESSIEDKRIKYSINIDGGFFANMSDKHVDAPCLVIRESPDYSDEDLKKKGRSREGWETMGRKGDSTFDRSLTGTSWPAYNIKIKGTGHFSFSDALFVLPDMVTRFGGKILDGRKNQEIVSDCIRTFIKHVGSRQKSEELMTVIKKYPEIFYSKTY
jgi:dienelactone hydrolase